jgi:fructoselysine-6-P-deglycase FrlB-like protein
VASLTETEITSQPAAWRRAAAMLPGIRDVLPDAGLRLAVIGCGTSYFVAQAFATLREFLGQGETDAFAASEMPPRRRYDAVLVISRSGTTTEVVRALQDLDHRTATIAISGVSGSPVVERATRSVVLDFADERSVLQTRFATTTLALLRAHLGHQLEPVAADAERALAMELPVSATAHDHFVFLGRRWTVALAHEAALKMREAAGAWTESYPALEYRHGPISAAGPRSLVWALGDVPQDVLEDLQPTGAASVAVRDLDPMAQLILVHRLTLARAEASGRDPDQPLHLSRSVILN